MKNSHWCFDRSKNVLVFFLLIFTNFCLQAQTDRIAIPKQQLPSTFQSENTAEQESSADSEKFPAKIVGGSTAARGEFPEFVQLFIEGAAIGEDPDFIYSWCGGSLLSTDKVLTAAHCTVGINASDLYALPNFYSFNDNITFLDLIPLLFKVEHPLYGQGALFNNDVAILSLTQPVGTPAAQLYAGNNQLAGFTSTIIGTGVLSEGGLGPDTLQKVSIPIVSNAVCQTSYGVASITNVMLCAGLAVGTKDSCQGDSGGPLWVTIEGQKTQAGIVSWGNGCAQPGFYGVYSRTSALIAFILQNVPNAIIVEDKMNNINDPASLNLLLLSDSI